MKAPATLAVAKPVHHLRQYRHRPQHLPQWRRCTLMHVWSSLHRRGKHSRKLIRPVGCFSMTIRARQEGRTANQ